MIFWRSLTESHRVMPQAVRRGCKLGASLFGSASARSCDFSARCNSSSLDAQVGEGALSRESWNKLSDSSKLLAQSILANKSSAYVDSSSSKQPSLWSWRHRLALSQAITLAESQNLSKQEQAGWLLTYLLHQPLAQRRRQESFRLGIAGAPGAGKSTFIEALGKYLLDRPRKHEATAVDPSSTAGTWFPEALSVVCVDPTSSRSGGSILGDKTRMQTLSSGQYGGRSYVRPAPSGAGTLGGLSTFTNDVVTLCQVSGFDLVIVETVGVGQSEVEVEQAVDMLLLLVPPAGGDDLQGVKKGIVEVADLVVVTKADGQLLPAAQQTASDYMRAMPYVRSFFQKADVLRGWEQPKVLLVSSATAEGLDNIWRHVSQFRHEIVESKRLDEKRKQQDRYWMWKNLQFLVRLQLQQDPSLRSKSAALQDQLQQGRMTPRVAAAQLLELFHQPYRQQQHQ